MARLQSPTTYQGGKQRLAGAIADAMQVPKGTAFHDLCCGSGAVSIELINRGHAPSDIYMVDAGPWGIFWNAVGAGTFSLSRFRHYCSQIPQQREHIKAFMEDLSKQDALVDTPYVFLLLQASSFGGKAIWMSERDGKGKWENTSFRSFWTPTATSNRRSPVNPMMPMPDTLLERTEVVCERMQGVHGFCTDVLCYAPHHGTVYIDPPYVSTTKYGATLDTEAYIKTLTLPCYVSEGKPLSSQRALLSGFRDKGGISGNRSKANAEWLSWFNVAERMVA